jgi:hypothetical protein
MDRQSIRGLLQFEGAKVKSLTFTPNKDKDPTASLVIDADLTPQLAETMRCREAIFRSDEKPHPNITRHDIDGILRDVELYLPHINEDGEEFHRDTYWPEDISCFRVNVDGMIVRLDMRARIKGRYLELVDFLAKINTASFEMGIRSRQSEFDWSGKVDGTKVDMAEGVTVEGPLFHSADAETCSLCIANVPRNDEGRHITEDALVACETDAKREPAIPDAREMGERRERRRKTRGELGQESDAEIQRRMKAVEVEVVQ